MTRCNSQNIRVNKPDWLKRSLPTGPEYEKMRQLLKRTRLATVCQEAQCPNQFECYSKGTATFMILGDRCSRNCRFCAVEHQPFEPPDEDEPARVSQAVDLLDLRYVVITSVTRDDLADGGAEFFVSTIEQIRKIRPDTLIEVLIPDLDGNCQGLLSIAQASPNVLNHNVETVRRLYPTVRPEAIYQRSLELLAQAKKMNPQMITKSGMMLGLGETEQELEQLWDDLLVAGCDILTMGQYLQPSPDHLPVEEFITPEQFARLGEKALKMGFGGVASGPFVRSSYEAEKLYRKVVRATTKGG